MAVWVSASEGKRGGVASVASKEQQVVLSPSTGAKSLCPHVVLAAHRGLGGQKT